MVTGIHAPTALDVLILSIMKLTERGLAGVATTSNQVSILLIVARDEALAMIGITRPIILESVHVIGTIDQKAHTRVIPARPDVGQPAVKVGALGVRMVLDALNSRR